MKQRKRAAAVVFALASCQRQPKRRRQLAWVQSLAQESQSAGFEAQASLGPGIATGPPGTAHPRLRRFRRPANAADSVLTTHRSFHEKFGDGIMSASDLTMHVEKEEDPK